MSDHSALREVRGVSGTRYALGALIGRGGQGAVYAVTGGAHAIKLVPRRSGAGLGDRLVAVRRLPIHDLDVSAPLELLDLPDTGYVMEYLLGLSSLATLIFPSPDANALVWYRESGGLRHRLRCLKGMARVVGQLHGRGIVYGDLSPNNVLIPPVSGTGSVWLIDPDNLRYASAPPSSRVFTPRYGAPEVMRGEVSTGFDADVHSLAVLIFQCLTLAHPFIGDAVSDGAPSTEMEALRGRLAWIDDINDGRNRSSNGLPRSVVLSPLLKELAEKAFGRGAREPRARPTASAWRDALADAAAGVVTCGSCLSDFYSTERSCPWCGTPPRLQLRLHITTGTVGTSLGRSRTVEVQPGYPASIGYDGRLVDPSCAGDAAINIWLDERMMSCESRNGQNVTFAQGHDGGAVQVGARPLSVALSKLRLHGAQIVAVGAHGCRILLQPEVVS